ncbi:tRNA (adenosine(37)-N6)-threonylcarbamoyltransferase complex ATPase subunit type 1 TsaE [Sphingorhabdus lutea]|uniref:tRNA threonylcarbamoyladenosine biosynthesis protein TsaE n=1 Tax=Sphingorhabdus lutea TaxID=1913578 RepID=A0A1L3JCB2_9SPHN|nr:tRNA (adenosine(37)-N6)-threonylcarbamoyltransferase complex ATPase subunit type 1 TsaE [Sphingorhabdus lutea]APG62766.1 tRNA (adenosine(37)-N6)-threonylcarbamoyltransferase complex ATPase subunit type 1 TsaE [Sphingorhabdus lutea]
MHQFTLNIANISEMQQFGVKIASLIRVGDVIALNGNLGAGKTTFAQSIIAALGYQHDISSPSYSIVHYYEPPELRLPLAHADFYRLNDAMEIEELGIFDMLNDGAAIIEWAGDYVEHNMAQYIEINIEKIDDSENDLSQNDNDVSPRKLKINLGSDWVNRWT